MKIIQVYESQSSDGYRDIGDGRYFKTAAEAENYAKIVHKGYATRPKMINVVEYFEGEYLKLESTNTIVLYGTEQERERKKKIALDKLTEEEKHLLGLSQ